MGRFLASFFEYRRTEEPSYFYLLATLPDVVMNRMLLPTAFVTVTFTRMNFPTCAEVSFTDGFTADEIFEHFVILAIFVGQ